MVITNSKRLIIHLNVVRYEYTESGQDLKYIPNTVVVVEELYKDKIAPAIKERILLANSSQF